ncbi:PRC1-carboxypeptidase y serine-type protease [Colletotrichum asianum]
MPLLALCCALVAAATASALGLHPGPGSGSGPELCDAGSQYWTGVVNVTDHKSIFFWYFESRHDPENAPLILWMSGGPGATGELGLFKGIGPCVVNEDGNSTKTLEYSWIDYANVVVIDQPAGVGFSHITNRSHIPVSLEEGGRDIHKFLRTFTNDVFPVHSGRSLHIAGESMGGHYVTGYTHHIMRSEREIASSGKSLATYEPLNIESAIIVDGYVDNTRQTVGYYDVFCSDWRRDGRKAPLMNSTACDLMAAAVPHCEILGQHFRETYNKEVCLAAAMSCDETVGAPYAADVRPGGWNPYDSRLKCQKPPLCSDFDKDATFEFFNRPWVQEMLGFPNTSFELIDFDTNGRWTEAKNVFLPVTRELTWLLDNTDIRVLFINGNNDIIINTPGQIRMLDEQPWEGQASFRAESFSDWHYQRGDLVSSAKDVDTSRGGTFKGNGRLSLYTVDEAGHFAPFNQPEAVGAVVRKWLQI